MSDLQALQDDIRTAIKAQREEAAYGASIDYGKQRIEITTRMSRDTRKSYNGGDYDEWVILYIHDGKVVIKPDWSADFDPTQALGEQLVFDVDMTFDDLVQMVKDIDAEITETEVVWKSFRMTRGERDALTEYAKQTGKDASQVIRDCLSSIIGDFPDHEHKPGRPSNEVGMQKFSKEYYAAQREFRSIVGEHFLQTACTEIDALAITEGIRPYSLDYKAPAPFHMTSAYDAQYGHSREVGIVRQYDDVKVIIRANRSKWGYKVTFADGREICS